MLTRALPIALVLAAGCPAEKAPADCQAPADCADPEVAPCEKCAPIAKAVCVEGACSDVPAADTDVNATVNVDRHTTVNGFVFAVAFADRSCTDVGSFTAFPADLNALQSGQKTFEGGTFHPDVPLGRVPAGDVLLLALGTDAAGGDGNVVAHGCVAGPAASNLQLNLAP